MSATPTVPQLVSAENGPFRSTAAWISKPSQTFNNTHERFPCRRARFKGRQEGVAGLPLAAAAAARTMLRGSAPKAAINLPQNLRPDAQAGPKQRREL